jgi:hypothetical protein
MNFLTYEGVSRVTLGIQRGTALLKKVFELVTGRSEQPLTTLDNTKILRLPVPVDITLFHPDYVNLRNTPLVEAKKVNLRPSPSPPPAVPLPQVSPHSSLIRRIVAAATKGVKYS